jgi:hypothetical protein
LLSLVLITVLTFLLALYNLEPVIIAVSAAADIIVPVIIAPVMTA